MVISREKISLSISKEIIMILLAVASIALIIFEITHHVTGYQYYLLSIIDIIITLLFLFDFSIGLYISDDKKTFWKQRWWELFACIPVVNPVTQIMRGIGVLRLLRILRVVAQIKRLSGWVDSVHYKIFSLAVTSSTLILLSTVMFYSFEVGRNPLVKNMFDSLWWAMSTVTTVGYGDIYPITVGGKTVGMFLMFVGFITLTVFINHVVMAKKTVTRKKTK